MLPERQERQGFPVAVAMELLRLTQAHAALGLSPAAGAGWYGVEERARDGEALADEQ